MTPEKVSAAESQERLRETLSKTKYPLVLGVGGGNDAVSTLMLQRQLHRDFGFKPEKVSVMAVLPDCLDYHGAGPTAHPLVHRIHPDTQRSVQGKLITQFPERVLSEHRTSFGIDAVLGISMRGGSHGMTEALERVIADRGHDLILACDVGGDFIAVPENHHVLSPMMDGYMLVALRELQCKNRVPIVYGVFGLGTDCETPPSLLDGALARLPDRYEGTFDPEAVRPIADFHRRHVEPVRYSHSADFTLRQIFGEEYPNPAPHRARFHTRPARDAPSKVYYGPFTQELDPRYDGKYYLFDDLQGIENPYAVECANGLEWFLAIQDERVRINHELNGQAFMNLADILGDGSVESIFFGTPSHKFSAGTQKQIIRDVAESVRNGVFTHALLFASDAQSEGTDTLHPISVTPHLILVSNRITAVRGAIRDVGTTVEASYGG